MTETITPPVVGDPAATPAPPAPAGNPPEGFVSRAELEREQARARTFQAEKDRLEAENTRLKTTLPAPTPSAGAEVKGFDPDAFSQGLLDQVYRANALSTAAASLRSEFPNADPSLFSPENLRRYGSVDALRIAAESDHSRVTTVQAATTAEIEARVRSEMIAAYGQEPPTGPAGSGAPAPGGDPTVQQLASMGIDEFAQYQADHPGVAERVLRANP